MKKIFVALCCLALTGCASTARYSEKGRIVEQPKVVNPDFFKREENKVKPPKDGKITVFTGSIPEENSHYFNGVKMNIPSKMFKIICYETVNRPGLTFIEILIANNSAYYINPKINKPWRLKYQAAAPTTSAVPKRIPVLATTSSIVIRPVLSDDAAGAS